ncbi:hypothetical protein QBC34DRAFT_396323 [Podospora aff. communis PSN243]|uniref:Uncharacterized protein n=1 Tax=Podospora aff. communis PSN243 TaxID=3040156 RepID=A0AAV9GXL3_9PEZI|nr:hypothetical protein QBC34DRAFT_396323 [Podospora aff. communis PSN243]
MGATIDRQTTPVIFGFALLALWTAFLLAIVGWTEAGKLSLPLVRCEAGGGIAPRNGLPRPCSDPRRLCDLPRRPTRKKVPTRACRAHDSTTPRTKLGSAQQRKALV